MNTANRNHTGDAATAGQGRAPLSAAQQELLARRLRAAREKKDAPTVLIPQRSANGVAPLSFAQQRLWFLDRLQPGSPLYNIVHALRLRGDLNVTALERALNELVRRHEILRTTFEQVNGDPVQRIAPSLDAQLRVLDLQSFPFSTREAEARRLAEKEAGTGFSLEHGPLFRAILVRISPADHLFVLTFHHIVFDGWSDAVLRAELGALYKSFCEGEQADLPELPLQYADFACWQRDHLKGEQLERMVAFWKEQLRDHPAPLKLPADRSPTTVSSRGATVSVMVGREVFSALQKLSREQSATSFIILLAAFKVLLHRYTGENDIIVGAPVAMRTPPELEKLIGFFVNTLALRDDLSGDPTFLELLERVRKNALAAFAHQDLPFDKLVEVLRPERSANQNAFFRIMFASQNADSGDWQWPGLTVTRLKIFNETAKFDLTLFLTETEEGLRLTGEYNTDLFDGATITRMLSHFRNLLAGIIRDPKQRLSELPLLSESERRTISVEWNQNQTDYPRQRCVHELFEAQAERRPDAIALVLESEHLSYRELNAQANRLARRLQEEGVRRGTFVAICVEPSFEMVVALLAILKAGGAYVPLAPDYPKERLAFMLADTKAPLLLTQRRLSAQLPQFSGKTILLDASESEVSNGEFANPGAEVFPDDLAYVIYTSGSTGRPKGVCVPHRGVVRLVRDTNYATFSADEVFLQFAPISFDASTFEIWGPLLNGGRLVIMPPEASSLQELGQAIARHKVTTLWLTAGLFHLMVDERLNDLRPLRQLLAGGDVLSVPHVRKAFYALPGCRLINGYGPTESTTFACCHTITERDLNGASIPIGRPISNTTAYILDGKGHPVPIGQSGELFIGGDGLAREYLNQPELTGEKFVRNPFSADENARLYRTGDLCRYRDDGTIEFLGRIDQQVKIRGFRIELEEIETVLKQHQQVREAIVIARADTPGDKRLVAYLVARNGALKPAELREFLKSHLPDYMMPSAFVTLDTLPLNPNGKVDRSALPTPDTTESDATTNYVAPRTPVEEVLVATWAEALGLDRVGIHENFFALGGHSLLAIQIIDRLNKAGLGLTLGQTLQHQTVAELAEVVNTNRAVESDSENWFSLVTLQSHGDKPPLFLVHTAPGDVLGYMKLVYYLGGDQPCYGFQSHGLLHKDKCHKTLPEMAAHYVKLLRQFQPNGPYYLGGWCFGGNVALEMAHQLRDAGEEVALLALMETWAHRPPPTYLPYYFHRIRCFLALGPKQWAKSLSRKLRRLLGIKEPVVNREDEFAFDTAETGPLKNREHVYEVNLRATQNYRSRPRVYDGKITLLRRASYDTEDDGDPQAGFTTLAREVETRIVPGSHRSILKEPHVRTLAKEIKDCLRRAQENAAQRTERNDSQKVAPPTPYGHRS